jgi:hypothetical protein
MRARPAPQTLDRTARFSQEKASSFSWSHKRKRFRERLGRSGYGQSVAKAAIVELVILAKQYREIELNSPTTKPCEICLMRRSVQSYIGINFFLLEESRFYDAANNTFLCGSVRVK